MDRHPEFRDAIKEAELISQVWWEELGVMGTMGEISRFSATGYIFQMKNRFPEDYGDHRVAVQPNAFCGVVSRGELPRPKPPVPMSAPPN